MKIDPKIALERCETLMLDMDGTVLDLAFDNYMWLHHVPEQYAEVQGIEPDEARSRLYAKFDKMMGRLEWYCLDHWSEILGLDIADLHRDQNHRIGYLPGAEAFLQSLGDRDVRVLMVTNSHQDTLDIKDDVTGLTTHFDGIYTSHSFGVPKERQEFWEALQEAEDFDPGTTLFIDDTVRVLESAHRFGVKMLLEITHPDTSAPARDSGDYVGVSGLRNLL